MGIGTNAPDVPLHVTGGIDVAPGGGGFLQLGASTGANIGIDDNEIMARSNGVVATLHLNDNGGDVKISAGGTGKVGIGRTPTANRLEVSGNASKDTAGDWLANSDARIKADVKTVRGALDKLDQVRLVSFRYSDEYRTSHPGVEDRRYMHVVAQEFAEVFPEYVKRSGEKLADGEDILQVDSYPLTIYAAAAVKELHSQLKEKDAKIAELKGRLAKLETMMTRLAQRQGGAK